MIFPSMVTSGELIIVMAVFSKQELLCRGGELETETVGINSSVMAVVCPVQGRRNVFTTGPAKLDHEDYAIKCVGGQQLHEY